MGKFQLFVLLSVVTCAIISTVESVPLKDSSIESENAAKCKNLCGFCGCAGYYCGDECLCECNSQTEGEAECVDTMKSNCKKLELPFEVLIQGPNINRMVRSLLYADPNEEVCIQSSESNQKKRSTISIYKPDVSEQQDEILSGPTAQKIDVPSEVAQHDSPIHVIVAQKLDTNIVPAEVEAISEDTLPKENSEKVIYNVPSNTESNYESENYELDLPKDDNVDRANIKRHIIDINQDITEFMRDADNSFLYKRQTDGDGDGTEGDGDQGEDVGLAAPTTPPPTTPAPFLPKFREAFQNIKAQIPTSAEIKTAWEGVRTELNSKINSAITDAKARAAALRDKINSPPQTPSQPAQNPPPALFNFLKPENDVGVSLIPVAPAIAPIAAPIQAEIAKSIATFRANNKLIEDEAKAVIATLSKNRWLVTPPLTPPLFVGSPYGGNDEGEEKNEVEKAEVEIVEIKEE